MPAFTGSQLACLSAVARVLLPEGGGLPGADTAGVARDLQRRASGWRPRVRSSVALLLTTWDWGPLLSRHRKRFTRLGPTAQVDWVQSCYRSRWAARRLHVAALKQVVFLVWASAPVVEQALGYDYRCRRDDEPHGNAREISGSASPVDDGPEPADYHRPGPATESGAIPLTLIAKRDFQARGPEETKLQTVSWPDLPAGTTDSAQVIVIGSGAGGAVVAATLAELGVDVVVLEEGPQVDERDFAGPAFDRFQRFCRDNGTTQVWGNPPIPLPLGRVVGGTTVVNSGTCFRAPDRVLARWQSEFGIEGASHDALDEHYRSVEDSLNVRPVPWNVLGPNGRAAHEGAVALGYSGGPLLRNIADCHGCGQCAFGCPTNAKQAMHLTYLPRAARAGARIYARCRADRIVIEDGRVRGVDATVLGSDERSRGSLRIDAPHVVVCAGAIHSPTMLRRSGISDPSGETGRNLRIHPATGVGGFFDERRDPFWKGTLQSYYIDEFFDSHEVMFEATTTVPSIGAGSLPGIGMSALDDLAAFPGLATLGFYVSDTSKGRVRTSPGGEAFPTYRLNSVDAHRMAMGLAIAAEVLLAAGAARVYLGLPGMESISAREDLEQVRSRRIRPEHLRLTAFHPMGTVRMGGDPERSVVDPFGRHHSVPGVWVADASTFPTCVGVNPQMTIMAFAKRTAEALAKEV